MFDTTHNHKRHDTALVENSWKTRILSVALGLVTSLQAATMFFSMRDLTQGNGAESIALSAGAGLVIGVAFWIAWHWLAKVGPHTRKTENRVMFLGIAALLTATAIGTTSWFVASAVGGGQALQKHMHAYMIKVDEQMSILTKNAAAEYAIRGRTSEIAAAWQLYAEQEEGGTVSGTKGCGPLCDTYKRAAAGYRNKLGQIDTVFDAFKAEKTKAEAMRMAMNRIASGDSSAGGQAKFVDLSAQLSQQIAKMDALTALDYVGGVVDIGTKSGSGVTSIKNEQFTAELKDKVKSIKDARIVLPSVIYETMTRPSATLEYASSVPGAWILGVTFDLLPFIMFLMLMLAASETRELAHHEPVPAKKDEDDRKPARSEPRLVPADWHKQPAE